MTRTPWLAVEFRHLAALAAVAREGSFRAAAEDLGYVQSAVSDQIAHLERSLGATVLERKRGSAPVALTQAGELLLSHFEQILANLAAAQADLEALRDGERGRLRIGATEPVAVCLLPTILSEVRRELPEVEIELVTASESDGLAQLLERGDVDAAFGSLRLPAERFCSHELLRDPYVLLTPATWSLASAGELPTPAQLSELPLIELAEGDHAALPGAELRAYGAELRYAFRADRGTAVQALVAAGMGAAVVPRMSADESDERVVALDLGDLLSPQVISLHWRDGRRRAPALERLVGVVAGGRVAPATPAPVATLAA